MRAGGLLIPRDVFSIVLVVIAMMGVNACNDSHTEGVFTEGMEATAKVPPSQSAHATAAVHTQEVVVQGPSDRLLHMIWVIDNSPSMADENKAVRDGITDFVKELKKYSKSVQVTMISRKIDPQLQAQGWEWDPALFAQNGIHFIDFQVENTSQVHILARYLSPSFKLFRKHGFEHNPETATKRLPRLSAHPSSNFFRDAKALKVLVVVTDDGEGLTVKPGQWEAFEKAKKDASTGVRDGEKTKAVAEKYLVESSVSFLSLIQELYKKNVALFRFFAFLDLKKESINQANASEGEFSNASYKNLQQQLGGQLWHIKDLKPEQWKTSVLADAQSHLIALIKAKIYSLDHAATKVQKVIVKRDGKEKELSESEYVLRGGSAVEVLAELKPGDTLTMIYESASAQK